MKLGIKKLPQTAELTKRQRAAATKHGLALLAILRSVTCGEKTIEDRMFANTMKKLRDEVYPWGFDLY
jgi:hypothetical protein